MKKMILTSKKSKKKGDIASPVFMWMAIFLVMIISGLWFVRKIRPLENVSQTVNYDLEQIKMSASYACSSDSYQKKYNPRTERGELVVNETGACINVTGIKYCTNFFCRLNNTLTEDLANITFIYIIKITNANVSIYSDNTIGDKISMFTPGS